MYYYSLLVVFALNYLAVFVAVIASASKETILIMLPHVSLGINFLNFSLVPTVDFYLRILQSGVLQ